jgi:adenosylcobinamide-GDP ribazoletransferase
VKTFKGILAQLSFFTIIPSVKSDLETIAKYSFIAPFFIGIITGIIDFTSYFILWNIIGNLAKILLFAIVELIRGFHHLDGMLDVSDALMVKGSMEKRLKALKDVEVGSGGIGASLVYFSIMLVALLNLQSPSLDSFLVLISSEIACRSLGLLFLATLKPMEDSYLGKIFNNYLRERSIFLIIQAIPFLLVIPIFLYFILYIIFYYIFKLTFHGSSGDLTGFVITLSFPFFLLVNEKFCYLFSLLHYFGI